MANKIFCFILFALLSANYVFAQTYNGDSKIPIEDKKQEILEKSLPKKVRVFLENADIFEVFVQAEKKEGKLIVKDNLQYFPNLKTEIEDYDKRLRLLGNFYKEVSSEIDEPDCYYPNHTIRATDGDRVVEIELSFSCNKFYVKGWLGEYNGRLTGNTKTTETLMNQILEEFGSEF